MSTRCQNDVARRLVPPRRAVGSVTTGGTAPVAQIIASRQSTRGVFRENTKFIQAVKALMREQPNWGKMYAYEMEALDMFAHKVGWILHGDPHFVDHWDDVAGYAQLLRAYAEVYGEEPLPGTVVHRFICILAASIAQSLEFNRAMIGALSEVEPDVDTIAAMIGGEQRRLSESDDDFRARIASTLLEGVR